MKTVVFKVRYENPNRKSATIKNTNYFSYISKKREALYNEGKSFSLFGKVSELGFNKFNDINSFNKIQKHIGEKTKEKTTFYKGVISLDGETALAKGYDKREEWEKLLKNNVSNLAKEYDIKIENFEYVASVHMEAGHPHMHLMFWDKEQEIQGGNINKQKLQNCRRKLNDYIFEHELMPLYQGKNESEKVYKNTLKNVFEEIGEDFKLTDEEFKKFKAEILAIDKSTNKGKIANRKLSFGYMEDVAGDIFKLKKVIPKKGRLNYAFMDEDSKKYLDSISKKIIENNTELNGILKGYLKSCKDVKEFTDNPKYVEMEEKEVEKEIYKNMGNKILNIYREVNKQDYKINKEEWEENKEEWEKNKDEYNMNIIKNGILDIISETTNLLEMDKNFNNNKIQNGRGRRKDLSRAEKREIAKKLESKSNIDWER